MEFNGGTIYYMDYCTYLNFEWTITDDMSDYENLPDEASTGFFNYANIPRSEKFFCDWRPEGDASPRCPVVFPT
ncbi:hypothetical protein CEXT_598371 [Caerostris extrusa]|uniref:Uncharacterized protein n=1 Tax=Caerostris extrusa TaxID=172846 RepID=A0AAV4Y4P1_CAEEX|nr:hypothetical protein CEXT_598371 [Caerostris extrusa]